MCRHPIFAPAVLTVALAACGPTSPPTGDPCRISFEAPSGEVGFGVTVRIRATVTCDHGQPPPEIVWDDGTRGAERVVKTPPAESLLFRDRAGLLPISPAQGTVHVRATAGTASAEHDVVAAHAQSGLPSVPVGVALYVHGGPGGSIQRVVPQKPGPLAVHDERTGFRMTIVAGRPDALPLDCHRSECHPTEMVRQAPTRHATVFERALAHPQRGRDEACLGCHTSGGARVPGGFVEVARAVGFWPIPAEARNLADLPRDLQRQAGVTCVACHGSAGLPPKVLRPTIWGTGICAQCHDQPPRYRTVEEWRTSRMSLLRPFSHEPECAICHTAQGFVVHQGVVRALDPARDTVEPVTCVACHDPHGKDSAHPRMMRSYDAVRGGSSAVCASCHRADLGIAPERRFELRLAPMAPQSELAPPDCIRCHQPHVFRARKPGAAEEPLIARLGALAERARTVLRGLLPATRGCNRGAGPARDIAVLRDRIAIVDADGRALGDCNGDGRIQEGEDPLISAKVASSLYARAYSLLLFERDRSKGLHDPARAEKLLEAALGSSP